MALRYMHGSLSFVFQHLNVLVIWSTRRSSFATSCPGWLQPDSIKRHEQLVRAVSGLSLGDMPVDRIGSVAAKAHRNERGSASWRIGEVRPRKSLISESGQKG